MSDAFQCDRCGVVVAGTYAGYVEHTGTGTTPFRGELCADCRDSLLDWWEGDDE